MTKKSLAEENKISVTVGIPAFNEEANIGYLVSEVLNQNRANFKLEKIIVASDGSDDKTVDIANDFGEPILVLANKDRQGVAVRQNQIFKSAKSDILVLLNADIAIKDRLFLERLIEPIRDNKAHLTSTKITELQPANFFEGAISQSMKIKNSVFKDFKSGNNVYTCHGPARAFSKSLYKKIVFKSSVGEDAYSYLFCIFHGYRYQLVKNTEVYYKAPTSLADHQKQSLRFFQSKKIMSKQFGDQFVKENYKIPLKLMAWVVLKSIITQPLQSAAYLLVVSFLRLKSNFKKSSSNTWDISSSSKVLRVAK